MKFNYSSFIAVIIILHCTFTAYPMSASANAVENPEAVIKLIDGQTLSLDQLTSTYSITDESGVVETKPFDSQTEIAASGQVVITGTETGTGAISIGKITGTASITLESAADLVIATTDPVGLTADNLTINGGTLNVTATTKGIEVNNEIHILGGSLAGKSGDEGSWPSYGIRAKVIEVVNGQLNGSGLYGVYAEEQYIRDGSRVVGRGSQAAGLYAREKFIVEGSTTIVESSSLKSHGIYVPGYMEVTSAKVTGIAGDIPQNVFAGIQAYELTANNATIVGQGMSHGIYIPVSSSTNIQHPGRITITNSNITAIAETGHGLYGNIQAVNSHIISKGKESAIRSIKDTKFTGGTVVEASSEGDNYYSLGIYVSGNLDVEDSELHASGIGENGGGIVVGDTCQIRNSNVTAIGVRGGVFIGTGEDIPNENIHIDHGSLTVQSQSDGILIAGSLYTKNESQIKIDAKNWGLQIRGSSHIEDSDLNIKADKYGIIYWYDDRNPLPEQQFIRSNVSIDMPVSMNETAIGMYNFGTATLPTGPITITGGTFKIVNDLNNFGWHSIWSDITIHQDAVVEVSSIKYPIYSKDITIDHSKVTAAVKGTTKDGVVYGAPDTITIPALYSTGRITLADGGELIEQYAVPVSKALSQEPSMPYAGGMNITNVTHYQWTAGLDHQNDQMLLEATDAGVAVVAGTGTHLPLTAIRTVPVADETVHINDSGTHTIEMTASIEGPAPVEYTVLFDTNGGNTIDPVKIVKHHTITEPAAPHKEGFVFDGWYTDNDTFLHQWSFEKDTVKEDMTLYSKWIEAEKPSYTVTFVTYGESVIPAQQVIEGGKVRKPADPVESGYTFEGWYANSGYKQKWDFEQDIVTHPMTLYAKWLENSGGGGYYPWIDPETDPDEPQAALEHHSAYIKGYSDNTFRPDGQITRAEAAMILYRLLGDSAEPSSTTPFTDVTEGAWYTEPINKLAALGIIKGYEDNTFRPNHTISRAESAAMTSRFMGEQASYVQMFPDVLQSHWASEYISVLVQKGWVQGYPDGTYKPNQSITRAESVKILNRMLDRKMDESRMEEYGSTFNDISSHWAQKEILEAAVDHDYVRNDSHLEEWHKE